MGEGEERAERWVVGRSLYEREVYVVVLVSCRLEGGGAGDADNCLLPLPLLSCGAEEAVIGNSSEEPLPGVLGVVLSCSSFLGWK